MKNCRCAVCSEWKQPKEMYFHDICNECWAHGEEDMGQYYPSKLTIERELAEVNHA